MMGRQNAIWLMVGGAVLLIGSAVLLAWGVGWRMTPEDAVGLGIVGCLAGLGLVVFGFSEAGPARHSR